MNIYQKLIEVRKEVPYLQKENEGHQYKYVGSSQVLASVRRKMDEIGLLLIPEVVSHQVTADTVETIDKYNNPKRTSTYFTELDMRFTWVNADSPDEKIACTWYGQGVDIAGEKGVGKAMTYAEKYFLLKQFNIATDKDDPDSFQGKHDSGTGNGESKPNNVTHLNDRVQQSSGITDAQRKALSAACKRNNIDGPTAMMLLQQNTNKKLVDELTTAEASQLIKVFSEYKEAK